MEAKDLYQLLDSSSNKLETLSNIELLKKYNLTNQDLLDLIITFLNDEEKQQIIHLPFINEYLKRTILLNISNKNIQFKLLKDTTIFNKNSNFTIVEILNNINSNIACSLLLDKDFVEFYSINSYDIKNIILKADEVDKFNFLNNSDYIKNTLDLSDHYIADIIKTLSNEDEIIESMSKYQFNTYLIPDIITNLSDTNKIKTIMEIDSISKHLIINILKELSPESLSTFFNNNKEYCKNNNISPFEITMKLNTDSQKEFINYIEQSNLTLIEKKEIFASLSDDVKQSINPDLISDKYQDTFNLKFNPTTKSLDIDLNEDFQQFKDLDYLINLNPENFSTEEKIKLMDLCSICPNMSIENTLGQNNIPFVSTGAEYREAETWILSLVNNIPSKLSPLQKLAFIDNAIGKKISYSPDFNTEIFGTNDSRALWKIISSGYGVCNGISRLEQYILKQVGIESEMISGKNHSFLKIKDIEIPYTDGTIQKGDTIIDPTWNLSSHRFGAYPNNFCIDYEQIRKNDIDSNGLDRECHKNDDLQKDNTLSLNEQNLRQLFTSINLADKDGIFPIKNLLDTSKDIDEKHINEPLKNIQNQFNLIENYCNEFANCQNSTITILSTLLSNLKNVNYNNCIVNRVYNKNDTTKKPVMYVYIDLNDIGQKFFYADNSSNSFIELPKETFINQFDCYDTDLEAANRN